MCMNYWYINNDKIKEYLVKIPLLSACFSIKVWTINSLQIVDF